jgi:hypothetical protein
VGSQREYPPEQIEWYLDRSRLDWGILTNGRLWRLVPRELDPQQRRFQTCLQADLPAILDAWAAAQGDVKAVSDRFEDFLRFYLFFAPAGFRGALERKALVRRAAEGSSEYRLGVSEDLKEQTFEALRICAEKKLSDWHLARVIDRLGRAKDPRNPQAGAFRVDYRDLAIQHLGGIYEGLLELRPRLATERMIVYARRAKGVREEIIKPESDPPPEGYEKTDVAYPPASVYLITDKGERRAFGSYYTLDHIVAALVRVTLGPLCSAITEQLRREITDCRERQKKVQGAERQALAASLTELERNFPERVLRLRVLDPAMGSSHFLLRACQYLAEEIATNPFTAADPEGVGDESALSYWKRRVVESCLYSVDLNPTAVELAKLALWLETVAADRPLTSLDHHLRHGNSLVGAKVARLRAHPGEEHGMFEDVFGQELARKLPAFLGPLADVRRSSSENVAGVKQQVASFKAFTRAATPFRQVADLWCAAAAGAAVTPPQYHAALDEVDRPVRFAKLTEEEWFPKAARKAREEMACFHWELDFPEVFFDDNGPLGRPGFDAVIGNPPYDVLSERESGRDLSDLRAFLEAEPAYVPSRRGKNNLYKVFVCRALDLLADGGRLGFITPMAVLGDDQAADLRREMVRRGSFTAIEAFPQKDDPTRRVFPEAKLSTAVFILEKGRVAANSQPFRSRVHPGRFIEEASPGLTLTTDTIPLYDPSNFTIVSCDQADWDLAVRVMRSGRMRRLKEYAEFFQGEVNETNERARGNLTRVEREGKLVTRGASICLYVLRPASQGGTYYSKSIPFSKERGRTRRHPTIAIATSGYKRAARKTTSVASSLGSSPPGNSAITRSITAPSKAARSTCVLSSDCSTPSFRIGIFGSGARTLTSAIINSTTSLVRSSLQRRPTRKRSCKSGRRRPLPRGSRRKPWNCSGPCSPRPRSAPRCGASSARR